MLLLKGHKARVERLSSTPRQLVQRILVYGARSVVLLDNLLKLSKAQEKLLLLLWCVIG